MKKRLTVLAAAISAITLLAVNGCKKSNTSGDAETDYTTSFTASSQDQVFVSAENDAVTNDINTLLETDSSLAGKSTEAVLCDATITHSSSAVSRMVTITYTGHNCNGSRTRTGAIVLTMPKDEKWRQAGARLSVSFQNVKITTTANNKSIVLNGTEIITNVSGGELLHLATLGSITHSIISTNLSVVFDNGTRRDWNVARKRVFTYSNGIVITTTGTHTDGSNANIAEWGTNRAGDAYSLQIAEPIVIKQDCDFRVTSGKIAYLKLARPVTVTFGLNSVGSSSTCPGTGHYYYKVEWTGIQNIAHSIILPY